MVSYIKFLKIIFVIPFRIGNPNLSSDYKTDGSSSAVILFSCLVSSIIVVIGTFSGQHRFNEVSMKVIWGLIVSLVTTATLNIFLLFCHIRKHRSRLTLPRIETDASIKLQLGFLWTFGLGLLLRTSLTIATNIECISEKHLPSDIGSIVSSTMMIVFMLSQIGLITYMRDFRFLRSAWIYYSIGMILLANASIWFNFTTAGIAGILHNAVSNTSSTDVTVNNASYGFCFFHSKIHSLSFKIQPYLFQVSLDFLLLAMLFIMRTWPSLKISHYSTMENELKATENEFEMPRTDHRKIGVFSVVIGIVFHIPFLVLALLIRFVYSDKTSALRETWQVSVIVQKTAMLFFIILAFSQIDERSKELNGWTLGSNDVVLLFCYVGKIILPAFGIIAATYCTKDDVLLGKGLTSLFFYFYHTLYIMISKRSSHTALKESPVSVFVHVLLFTLNMTQWITTTFILSVQGNYVLNEGEGCLFVNPSVWIMIQYIFIPFTVYYDFQSAMHFYSILPRFSYAQRENVHSE